MTKPKLGLNIFKFRDFLIRIIIDNFGEPWIVVLDMFIALGYKGTVSSVAKWASSVDPLWQGRYTLSTPNGDLELITIREHFFKNVVMGQDKAISYLLAEWYLYEISPQISRAFPDELKNSEPLSGDELKQALAQFNNAPVLRTEAPAKQPVVSTAKTANEIIQTKPITDAEQAQAKLIKEHGDQITAIIKQQAVMTKVLDGVARMVGLTSYAHREQRYDAGNLTIGGTAECLGTKGDRLLEYLQQKGVLSAMTETGVQPAKHYLDQGYFVRCPFKPRAYGQPLCPEVMVTAMGRAWLHQNACLGWLDPILFKRVLATRVPAAADMPLDLFEFEPRSF